MVDSFFSSPFCLKMYQYFKEKFIIGHSSEWKGYLIDNLLLEVEIFWGDSSQNMKTDCVEHVLTHGLYSLRSALQLRVSQNLSNNDNYSEKGNIMWSQEELRPKYVKIQIHQVDWTHIWDQLKWTVIRKLTIWVYYHHAMVKMDILFPLTKTYFVSSFTRYFLGCLLKNFKLPIFQLIQHNIINWLCPLIIHVRVALERNVVWESDWHFSNLSRSIHQSPLFALWITCTHNVKTSVNNCPFQVYSHLNDNTTGWTVTLWFQSIANHTIIIIIIKYSVHHNNDHKKICLLLQRTEHST